MSIVIPFCSRRRARGRTSRDHTGFLHLPSAVLASREGFSYPFISSTAKSNFVYPRINPSPLVRIYIYIFFPRRFVVFVWCPCMATNVSVQYNGVLIPDIILLAQCYYHWGTRLNATKRFCIFAVYDPT